MEITITKIKQLISRNELSQALNEVSDMLNDTPNWLIQLQARLEDFKHRKSIGSLSQSEEIQLQNQIRFDLLESVEKLNTNTNQLEPTTTNSPLVAKAFIKNNDVYVALSDGSDKRLTFNGMDEWAALRTSFSQVIFVRVFEHGSGRRKYKLRHLMSVEIDSLEETIIADVKPYRDGLDAEYRIFYISYPFLSEDEQYLYFVCERYATGMALFELNLTTNEWLEISPAHYLKVIHKGSMKGQFAVETSENRGQGRQWYPMIIDRKGKVLKEFSDRDALDDFLNS